MTAVAAARRLAPRHATERRRLSGGTEKIASGLVVPSKQSRPPA
jgi:hypothetical protein